MKAYEILAFIARHKARKYNPSVCACGLVQLGYQPERKTGAIIHGVLVCRKEVAK